MNRSGLVVLLLLGAWIHLPAVGSEADTASRTWVSADGKYKVEATLLAIEKDSVRLRRFDDKEIDVPLAKLSQGDLAYLAESVRRTREASGKTFTVEGVLSIASPGDGFRWQRVQDIDAGGVKGFVLVCSKEGASTAVTLVAELRPADTDGARVATIKGNYNGLVSTLQQAGFTELKGTRPPMEPPIPDIAAFTLSGKKPDGSPAELRAASVFGKHTYAFQVISDDAAEADRLIQLAKTLQEFKE